MSLELPIASGAPAPAPGGLLLTSAAFCPSEPADFWSWERPRDPGEGLAGGGAGREWEGNLGGKYDKAAKPVSLRLQEVYWPYVVDHFPYASQVFVERGPLWTSLLTQA